MKGVPKPKAPPPPVRESNMQAAQAGDAERKKAALRRGAQFSINPGQSLLSDNTATGQNSLLG